MLGVTVLSSSPDFGFTLSSDLQYVRIDFTSKSGSCASVSVEISVSQVVRGLLGKAMEETVRGLEIV